MGLLSKYIFFFLFQRDDRRRDYRDRGRDRDRDRGRDSRDYSRDRDRDRDSYRREGRDHDPRPSEVQQGPPPGYGNPPPSNDYRQGGGNLPPSNDYREGAPPQN